MTAPHRPLEVAILNLPEAMLGTTTGMYEVLNGFDLIADFDDSVPKQPPIRAQIVDRDIGSDAPRKGPAISANCSISGLGRPDVIIIPSLAVENSEWISGRYPDVVAWLREMHTAGVVLCSACSGVLLLAETGLLDGQEATIHWAFARTFQKNFPQVPLALEKVLIATGARNEFILSGGSASWHDLVLFIIARHVSPTAAQAIAKFMLLQWHKDGHAPYAIFQPVLDHGDAAILQVQHWLIDNYAVASPVEQAARQSGLPERTFKRRFHQATGYTPIAYVQNLRIKEARRRLERTNAPVDEISWQVGYEDPAFFRRLFKRITGVAPGAYRRKFSLPEFARDFVASSSDSVPQAR